MFQAINSVLPFDVEEPRGYSGNAQGAAAPPSAHVGYQPLSGGPGAGMTQSQQGYSDGEWKEQGRLRHFFGLG